MKSREALKWIVFGMSTGYAPPYAKALLHHYYKVLGPTLLVYEGEVKDQAINETMILIRDIIIKNVINERRLLFSMFTGNPKAVLDAKREIERLDAIFFKSSATAKQEEENSKRRSQLIQEFTKGA